MGIAFYHFEAYSRIESSAKSKKGKSIYTVAGEADREQGFCDHVKEPKKPILLYGVPFSEVVTMAEKYAENTKDSQGRAVKINGLCMIAGVVSASHDKSEKVWKEYKKIVLGYLQRRYGDNLKSVIEHTDEYFEPDQEKGIKSGILHRHIHFACVPPIGINFAEIHPGLKAKREADKAYGISKPPESMDNDSWTKFKKEGRKAGDLAYKKAMKMEQDDFHINVSVKVGDGRYGPRKKRLNREEIKEQQHMKRLKQESIVNSAKLEEEIKENKQELSKIQDELEKKRLEKKKTDDEIKEKMKTFSDREKTIKERETIVNRDKNQIDDFKKGFNTSLKGWQLPKPKIGEFSKIYYKRIVGEVMGIVQRALNTINEFNRKKKELEKEKADFEAEKREKQKQDTIKAVIMERNYNDKVNKQKSIYEKLINKVLGIKSTRELTILQSELTKKSTLTIP